MKYLLLLSSQNGGGEHEEGGDDEEEDVGEVEEPLVLGRPARHHRQRRLGRAGPPQHHRDGCLSRCLQRYREYRTLVATLKSALRERTMPRANNWATFSPSEYVLF